KQVAKARLYATGLGVYNVYINGQRVGITHDDGTTEQDELKPGFTEFHKTVFYTTHDVTALIQQGDNGIGAELTSGWWSGNIAHGMYGSKPLAFKGKLVITYTDGTEEIVDTDTSWRCSTSGPVRSGDIYNGETYDARLESNWSCAGYDDSQWETTAVSNDFKGTIRAFEAPAVKAVTSLARHPKTITIYEGSIGDNSTLGSVNVISETSGTSSLSLKAGQTAVIDLAQNAAGWISFKVKGNRGTRLRIRFAEMLNTSGNSARGDDGPKGSIYTANLRGAQATVKYTLKGDPEGESYHPTTTFFGFRYMEIVSTDDVELTNVVGETVTSAMDEYSTFSTSHPDVNQLYSNVMWGQRSNFLSVPTDCPQRDERQGWTADTQVYSMAGLYNADTRTFYEKWMRDMRDSQRSDGAFPHIAPYAWNVGFGAAAWADAGIILPWKVYLMTGDKQIIEDNWEAMERYMAYLATQGDGTYKYNGGGTDYGDWVSYAATDSRYCSVCYYAYDAQLMAKMAKVLSTTDGDKYAEKAKEYENLFEAIKTEWQKRYTTSSTGLPNIKTQCAYLMALKYNLLKDATAQKRTISALRSAIVNNGHKLNTGFLGTAILNQTLTEVGLNDEAYTLLLQRNDPSWLYSIDQGATTIWERWNSYTVANGYGPVSMNSFNHYAYGIVAEWMFRYMAGIMPDETSAGFRHFTLAPNSDRRKTLLYAQKRITSVEANHWSPMGAIKAAWQCDGGDEMRYDVTIPANSTATLYLPVADGLALKEGGKLVSQGVEGVQYMGIEDGKAVCQLGSGTYSFSVGTDTGISGIDTSKNVGAGHVYNINGVYLGQNLNTLPRGIYLHDGKKTAK
ncbi:MAG: family 78 glycoside hydrolase catalytic domain, partial [Bacteroidaceae bacterium]